MDDKSRNAQQDKLAGDLRNVSFRLADGKVVDNFDPEMLGRVRVEILGKTDKTKKEELPWLEVVQPIAGGGSAYTMAYSVPQINTQVKVLFADDFISGGVILGSVNNRLSTPFDPDGVSKDYKNPPNVEPRFTKVWDIPYQQPSEYSPDLTHDYPYSRGWVDNALNWFKVNMAQRCVEFITNSKMKFKNYHNGNTVVHITGHLKVVIDKDFYIEVRGNRDDIVCKDRYTKTWGNEVRLIDKQKLDAATLNHIIKGKKVLIN